MVYVRPEFCLTSLSDVLEDALHLGSVFGSSTVTETLLNLLTSRAVGDTLMAIASAYYLLQRKPEDGLKRTDDLVNALVRLTFQCAAPAALL